MDNILLSLDSLPAEVCKATTSNDAGIYKLMSSAEAGQEFILFSWKLVACDFFIALYVLFVSAYVIILGSSITTPVVISGIFT
jgi:hypothetical protein